MEIPWMSSQFIEKVLQFSKNDNSIRVINYSIKPATNSGDNYVSIIYRATVEFCRSQNIGKAVEKKTMIIKVAPSTEGPQKEIAIDCGLFATEINMMTSTLQEMQLHVKNIKLGADCYFTQSTNSALIVMEDLAPLGFEMAHRTGGLDFDHSILVIRALAAFHASSVAVCEMKPEYKDTYEKGLFRINNPPVMSTFFIKSMRTLANFAGKWPELGPEYQYKLEKLVDTVYPNAAKSRLCDESEFNVINHGDLWVNNMLFKYDDKGKVNDHIFVDFQQCVYGSPAIDLTHFLNASVDNHVFVNNKNELLNEYLDVLTTTMKSIGCKTAPPSMNDLQKALRKIRPFSFVTDCTVLPLILNKPDEALEFEKLFDQDDSAFNAKALGNEAFKKAIIPRLIDWNNLGLLDKWAYSI